MKITVLGSGSSVGTPAAGGFWGKCNPETPRNYRTRASLLVQGDETNILIDATVDVRMQLTDAKIQKLDAVLFSHCHADHINGMDDLRVISYKNDKPIDMYTNQETIDDLARRFSYVTEGGMGGIYRPFLTAQLLQEYDRFTIGEFDIDCFPQKHANVDSIGFRFDDFAYSVDVVDFDEKSLDKLKGIDTWIIDGAGYERETPTTHATLKQVKEWVDYLKPRMTYLTVLTNYMDYDALCQELPDNIRPCYDKMVLEF